MSLERLGRAHNLVQTRKEAAGSPSSEDVVAAGGNLQPLRNEQGAGVLVGTDLTLETVKTVSYGIACHVAAVATTTGQDLVQALGSAYTEGLLVGIEYGRLLAAEDHAEASG